MIDMQIEGRLPSINTDLTQTMDDIRRYAEEYILQGFESSGYGRWAATREGRPATLRGIRNTVKSASGDNWAEVSAMDTIHQRGGVIDMNAHPRMRKFFWAKWYETNDEKWKWMALSRGGLLGYPQRKYIVAYEAIITRARELLGSNIIRASVGLEQRSLVSNFQNIR